MAHTSEPEVILQRLDEAPRLGWVDAPSPVGACPVEARELGLEWLGVKWDGALPALVGGTKVRKLDYVLAEEPYRSAPRWASVGAIGSGHLVALTAAACRLERRLEAFMFWTPSPGEALPNLAYVASGPTHIHYRGSRVGLALMSPHVLLGPRAAGGATIPPGATSAAGVVGVVRGAVELALQVEAGELPAPDAVYAPFGTGGVVAGLALGFALVGMRPQIVAVAAVEPVVATRWRLRRLLAAGQARLGALGLVVPMDALPPVRIDHGQLGAGYGATTPESLAACARPLAPLGGEGGGAPGPMRLEPIYSGKAFASLVASARRGAAPGARVLLWGTPGRPAAPPADAHWMERLPPALRRRVRGAGPLVTRRRVVVGGLAAGVAAALAVRVTGYPPWPDWPGRCLPAWQGTVLARVAEALLPPAPDGGAFAAAAVAADRYAAVLPPHVQRELVLALTALEHGTTPLWAGWSRSSALPVASRRDYLMALKARGGLQYRLYRAARDLVMMGYYQQPDVYRAIGFSGPLVGAESRSSPYDALRAAPGTMPRGWVA